MTTKTAGSSCAWRAHYGDGKLVAPKPGQSAAPKATAGRGGTQITVEDLFYNVPTRRRAFRSSSEEYAKILDVVGRYAVHRSGVAFSCRKHGDAGVSISMPATASTTDRIRQIHGSAVANELIGFDTQEDKNLGFHATGLATSANYHGKRTVMLLFINHRSVESTTIKRAVEQTYSAFLPKGDHPFVYLDLEIEPQRVDVNVHPTKREVNFLNEDEIVECICNEVRSKLARVDSSRTFMTQSLLPGARAVGQSQSSEEGQNRGEGPLPSGSTTQKRYEHNLVRTDSRVRKITSMLAPAIPHNESSHDSDMQYEITDREPLHISLTSVKSLRATVREAMHKKLTEAFASHTYVGLVDEQRRIAAIQSGVKLYLVDYGMVCNEFFYQIGLTDFGNFGSIKLDPAPKLGDLLQIAAQQQAYHPQQEEDGAAEAQEIFTTASQVVTKTLVDRREMLHEYFSLDISADGSLVSIPLLLKGYVPSLAKLPNFLLRLGPYVNWSSEQECFQTFLAELAAFYTPEQLPPPVTNSGDGGSEKNGEEDQQEDDVIASRRAQMVRMLEYSVFPALRARLVATTDLLRGVVEVADLKGLYRVFERC